MKTKLDFKLLYNKRNEIIKKIKTEQLTYSSSGNIILPPNYKICSNDGNVTVYHKDGKFYVISFWISRGVLSGSAKVTYSNGGKKLIFSSDKAHPIRKIDMLKKNWYYVETDY